MENITINDHPLKVVVVNEAGETINDHPLMVTPVGGEGGTPITVEKDGASVVTNLATLNFTGAGVSVADGGSGEATITITAGGGGDGYTQKSQAVTDTTPIEQDSTFVYLNSPATTIETSLVDGHVIVVLNASGASSTVTGHINGADANPYEIPSTQVMTLFCALDMSDFGSPGVITWIALAGGGGGSAVTSVNGQTGDVNITASGIGAVAEVQTGTGISASNTGGGEIYLSNTGVTSINGETGAVFIDVQEIYDYVLSESTTITSYPSGSSVYLRKSGSPYTLDASSGLLELSKLVGEPGTQLILNDAGASQNSLRIGAGGLLKGLDITLTTSFDTIVLDSKSILEDCTIRMSRNNTYWIQQPISLRSNATDITIRNNVFIDETDGATVSNIRLDLPSPGRTVPLYAKFINNTVYIGDTGTSEPFLALVTGDLDISGNTFVFTGEEPATRNMVAGVCGSLRFTNNRAIGGDNFTRCVRVNGDIINISNNVIHGFTQAAIELPEADKAIVQGNLLGSDIEILGLSTDVFIIGNLLTAGAINDAGTGTTLVNNITP